MGKFDGVLLATDFDDTYCAPGNFVHPDNLRMLERFTAQGGAFTVATGRPHRTFAPLVSLCPVNVPVILSNGAQLYDFAADTLLWETLLPPEVAADMADLAAAIPDISIEVYHGEEVYLWNPGYWSEFHARKAGIQPEVRPIGEMPLPWSKAILQNDPDILRPAQDYILSRWGDRYEAIFSNFHMLELTAKGCSKGAAVLELAARLGVARKDIYCVGDNQNDLPMLRAAAVPFAPANCTQEIKDFGAVLLPPCEEGAIAQLIRILDRRY